MTGLLAIFIVIAFFGTCCTSTAWFLERPNKNNGPTEKNHFEPRQVEEFHLPFSCRLALILAAVPVFVFGVYIPEPLHDLLTQAAAALTK